MDPTHSVGIHASRICERIRSCVAICIWWFSTCSVDGIHMIEFSILKRGPYSIRRIVGGLKTLFRNFAEFLLVCVCACIVKTAFYDPTTLRAPKSHEQCYTLTNDSTKAQYTAKWKGRRSHFKWFCIFACACYVRSRSQFPIDARKHKFNYEHQFMGFGLCIYSCLAIAAISLEQHGRFFVSCWLLIWCSTAFIHAPPISTTFPSLAATHNT